MNVATSSPVDDLLNPGESASRPVRILAAAGRMFIEHGYEGASMEEIAKAAAVTRQTLYNRFPEGKESLFVAVAERMWKAFPVMHVPTDERALADPKNGLMQIATEFACFWSGPTAADFLRMIFLEGRRFSPCLPAALTRLSRGQLWLSSATISPNWHDEAFCQFKWLRLTPATLWTCSMAGYS